MQICDAMKLLRIGAVPVVLILFGIPAVVTARAQATPSAAAPVQLQPYTAPDKSASVGLPSGWQVTSAGSGAIAMAGPQGETVNVKVILAYDGPFQLGQRGPSGADLTMPSSTRLSDKLVMVLKQQTALNGLPVPQFKYLYAAPIHMPSGKGQCGTFAISAVGGANPDDEMGIFCSFAGSSAKFFKSFLMYGKAPTTVAAQALPTIEAVLKSYRLAPGWTQKILSAYTPAGSTDPGPGGSGYGSRTSGSTSPDDGPGLGGGYNPGPGGSAGYPNNPPNASRGKSTALDGPGGSGYPNNPPNANGTKSTALDGPGLGGGYNPGPGGSGYPSRASGSTDDGPGLGGGYNPGPGGSAGYPYGGSDPSESYSEVLGRNQQVIDQEFVCVDASILGNRSPSRTPAECGGWKPNF